MLKRAFDVLASSVGLLVLSPLFLLCMLAVKRSSEGPVFYRAERVGQHGKPFKLFKFRSMVINADQIGPAVTGAGDPRITRVGRFLRSTKLDELPQLLNVLRGEMSFVGPRPESPRYVALYTPEQRRILQVKPGITSLASLTYRHEESILQGGDVEEIYIKKVMPEKLALDMAYIERANLLTDLGIIFRTLAALFRRDSQSPASDA